MMTKKQLEQRSELLKAARETEVRLQTKLRKLTNELDLAEGVRRAAL